MLDPPLPLERAQRDGHRLGLEPATADELVDRGRLARARLEDARAVRTGCRTRWRSPPPAPRPGRQPEGDEHVVGIEERLRAVGQQCVAAFRGRIAPRAGNDEDGPRVLEPVVGGDARAAAQRRLHHHDDVGERGDDAVAYGEPEPVGLGAESGLAQEHAGCTHALEQHDVPARVDDVEAGGDHAHDTAPGIEGPDVRGAVDPDGEAADDGDTAPGQERAQLACVGETVHRG